MLDLVLDKRDTGDMTDPQGRGDAAILRPSDAAQHIAVSRMAPSPRWSAFVEYYWIVRWECPEPFRQQVIPQPCVTLSAEVVEAEPRLLINGISREPFFRTLDGSGHVLGATFKPASFRPILRQDVSAVAGQVVPMADLVGPADHAVAAEVVRPGATDAEMVASLEAHLDACGAEQDPSVDELNALVRRAETDRSIIRAQQLADVAAVSLRTLQRQFTSYLGIGPKWVVQRFRLLDAAAAAHATERTDWAALAVELGFTDQAHLVRAFAAVVGTPPSTYEQQA